jgi:D-glycero-alpha-D-manno-heptose 1-phosphate guanylyltransferase
MNIKEAIILAGGLGTRLRSTVPDLPKCLAPVAGKPFLFYVIDHFQKQGIQKFIFAVGYKQEMIHDYLQSAQLGIDWVLSAEAQPLGTGGAVKLAVDKCVSDHALIINGDTLFKIDVPTLVKSHVASGAECSLSLKPMENIDRYGLVELKADSSVRNFKEKKFYPAGLINGGVYALRVDTFRRLPFPAQFSFESDYLEKRYQQQALNGVVQDVYFIDIGIAADYEKAQTDLQGS